MALIVRNDEQIKVGTTPGLVAGASSFTFDGTQVSPGVYKPDYRNAEIVISELTGRGILVKGLDYTWVPSTGQFDLIQLGDEFSLNTYYNVHFQPLAQPLVFDHYSFINSSFFIRDINLVNLTETKVLERINYFIAKYETECLRKILGLALYDAVLTESSQRITDLAYGVDYIMPNEFERRWYGLVHDINISLIANYVYYYFQKANALQTVGTSTKASKSEAGTSESPADKMIAAWQFFASETRSMCSFLWNKTDLDVINGTRTYPEFTSEQYCITMDLARKGGVNKFGF